MSVAYNPSIVTSGLVSCFDAANKKSYSQNQFQYTTDIFAFTTNGANAATLSRDSISSPAGNTPLKMAISGNDPHWAAYNAAAFNIAPAVNGETWIVSVYVKASVATTGEIFIFNANASGDGFANNDYGATGFTITTEWTRVQYVRTMNSVNTAFIQVRLDGTPSGGSGQTIWWDGLQVERVPSGTTSPTPYNSIYYGGNVFRDLTIYDNDMTIYGAPAYNSSGYFTFANNQTTQYIMDSSFPNPATAVTYNIWFRSNFFGPVQTPFTYSVGGNNEMLFFIPNSTTFQPHPLGNNAWTISTSDMTNVWVNATWTRDSATGVNILYRNGVQIGTFTASAGTNITTNGYLIIGQESDSGGGGFDPAQNLDGDFSYISIYNRVLSSTEVAQNFNAIRIRYGL
jgi:hypothetical protein